MLLPLHWLQYLFHSHFANKLQNQNKVTNSSRSSKKYIPVEVYISLKSYNYKGTNLFSFHYYNTYADFLGFSFVSAWLAPSMKMCSLCSDQLNFKKLLCGHYLFTSCGHEPQVLGILYLWPANASRDAWKGDGGKLRSSCICLCARCTHRWESKS